MAHELADIVKEHVRKEISMNMQPLLERLVSAEFEIRALKAKESVALPKAIVPDDNSWRGPGAGQSPTAVDQRCSLARMLALSGPADEHAGSDRIAR